MKIFVSYRREHTEALARDLFHHLEAALGAGTVFRDADSIRAGVDYRTILKKAMADTDVTLAIIGPSWLTAKGGALAQRNDFVRSEIREAIEREIPILTVLVNGAESPPAGALPGDIRALARAETFKLRDAISDVVRLASRIRTLAEDDRKGKAVPAKMVIAARSSWKIPAGIVAFVVVGGAVGMVCSRPDPQVLVRASDAETGALIDNVSAYIDGVGSVGFPDLRASTGAHKLEVFATGYWPVAQTIVVRAGSDLRVDIVLRHVKTVGDLLREQRDAHLRELLPVDAGRQP